MMNDIAGGIIEGQDKAEMLRRALERIIQLYTDKSHFVYEILQNAEDAQASRVRFVQYPDRLEIFHNGKPFTKTNLQGLCDIGKSDKISNGNDDGENLNQIGEFGVGFKSVFSICETVRLYSAPHHFRNKNIGDAQAGAIEIVNFTDPKNIPAEKLDPAYTTRFVFPFAAGRTFSGFKTIDELREKLSQRLQNLGITTLLFMRHLESIEYEIRSAGGNVIHSGEYLLDKKEINDHCTLASALGRQMSGSVAKERNEDVSFLMFSRKYDPCSSKSVDIAFPVKLAPDGSYQCVDCPNPYISVYFPTETESKLGFVVQGPFRTTPNRSSVPANDDDNKRLAQETATLLKDAILELRDSGIFNLSFIKALVVADKDFDAYDLFRPLNKIVRGLFARERIIPSLKGEYITARQAQIARSRRLTELFSDSLLSELRADGQYRWLPTSLTETNSEYELVYKFFANERFNVTEEGLKISVLEPEDLGELFAANRSFLTRQSNEWIISLYSILATVSAAFSKIKNKTKNLLETPIIKASNGKFVAPFRKEGKQYVQNIYPPSKNITNEDVLFVDPYIYAQCQHFFDSILQLHQADEYAFFKAEIEKRYSTFSKVEDEVYFADLKKLSNYLRNETHREEVTEILTKSFPVLCSDGRLRYASTFTIYSDKGPSGVLIKEYLQGISNYIHFVTSERYLKRGISFDVLKIMNVRLSILCDEHVTCGTYDNGKRGSNPSWTTDGDFRWRLSIIYLKDALMYISKNPVSSNSIIKSQTIFSVLRDNESRLVGTVHIGGSTPDKENETCELIKILNGERTRGWNGKWLFTKNNVLVSHREVTRGKLNWNYYGDCRKPSIIFDLLGFDKSPSEMADGVKERSSPEELDAYFRQELKHRFGLTLDDLKGITPPKPGERTQDPTPTHTEEFPSSSIKNWQRLQKHAGEMLVCANPVKYEKVLRSIRTTNQREFSRAYLMGMYQYEQSTRCACQMCHQGGSSFHAVEIFERPDVELDPMNLCLCPSCAATYRQLRKCSRDIDSLKSRILALRDSAIERSHPVALKVGDHELWFTQTHIAEIRTLLQLQKTTRPY